MTSTELVHVPRTTTVYDSASPLYRFLHRQITRVRAVFAQKGRPVLPDAVERVIARYTYKGRHHTTPGEPLETRIVVDGKDTGDRFHWTEPTLRQRISETRRNRRQKVRMPLHDTGAYPTVQRGIVARDDEPA